MIQLSVLSCPAISLSLIRCTVEYTWYYRASNFTSAATLFRRYRNATCEGHGWTRVLSGDSLATMSASFSPPNGDLPVKYLVWAVPIKDVDWTV